MNYGHPNAREGMKNLFFQNDADYEEWRRYEVTRDNIRYTRPKPSKLALLEFQMAITFFYWRYDKVVNS